MTPQRFRNTVLFSLAVSQPYTAENSSRYFLPSLLNTPYFRISDLSDLFEGILEWKAAHTMDMILCEACHECINGIENGKTRWTRRTANRVECGHHVLPLSLFLAVEKACAICTTLWNELPDINRSKLMGNIDRYEEISSQLRRRKDALEPDTFTSFSIRWYESGFYQVVVRVTSEFEDALGMRGRSMSFLEFHSSSCMPSYPNCIPMSSLMCISVFLGRFW